MDTVFIKGLKTKAVIGAFDIVDLPDRRYKVVKRIPVEFEAGGCGESIATFKEADIAMSGESRNDAYYALRQDISGIFTMLLQEEPNLAVGAERRLSLLKSYIEVS